MRPALRTEDLRLTEAPPPADPALPPPEELRLTEPLRPADLTLPLSEELRATGLAEVRLTLFREEETLEEPEEEVLVVLPDDLPDGETERFTLEELPPKPSLRSPAVFLGLHFKSLDDSLENGAW